MSKILALVITILIVTTGYFKKDSPPSDIMNDESLIIESYYIQDADELHKTYRQKISEGTAEPSMYSDICLEDYWNEDYVNVIETGLKGLKMIGWTHEYKYHDSSKDWVIGSLLYYVGVSYMEKDDPDNQSAIEFLEECAKYFTVVDQCTHGNLSNRIMVDYYLFIAYCRVGETLRAKELLTEVLNNNDYKNIYQSVENSYNNNDLDTKIAEYYQLFLDVQKENHELFD